MPFDLSGEFSRIEGVFARWVEDALGPCDLVFGGEPERVAETLRVRVTRIGLRESRREGRLGGDRRLLAEHLVTVAGPSEADADVALARLVATAAPGADEIAPLDARDALWRALRTTPRPALLVCAPFALAEPRPDAKKPITPVSFLHGLRRLEGRLVSGAYAPLPGARLTGEDGETVESDADGRFTLRIWRGGPILVEHGAARALLLPDPGADDVVLAMQAEV